MVKIALDAFGGDNAPLEILKGAELAVKESDVEIILTGDEKKIRKCAEENNISLERMSIVHTEDVMSMHDPAGEIIKSKKKSSMAVAMQLVADSKADAFVSAGSTAAIVFGGTFIIKRIKGVKRAALGSFIPGKNANFFLMDEGANAECRPEMLQQFGIMAYIYLKNVEDFKDPTIGLLNIGTEETKGGELQLKAHELLKNSPINFIGNVEARDIPRPVCDAVITDGFTGNIALKLYEGVSASLMSMLKNAFLSSFKGKLAAGLMLSSLKEIKKKSDYSEIGGAPLLGVRRPVIKAHGSSNALAIKNAICQARVFCESNAVEKISDSLKEISAKEA